MLYNNTKKRWEIGGALLRGVIYIDYVYVEYGYFETDPLNVPLVIDGKIIYLERRENCKIPLYWANNICCYTIDLNLANNIITDSKCAFNYPIDICYNFSKLSLKPKDIKLIPDKEFTYIKDFTFGLEYETSAGNIPWLSCIDTNLVPLYDGSIDGHEYVTFPLTHVDLPIIKQHLKLLERYTFYNKNCSLHIHFGNFPINNSYINRLCKFWCHFQWSIGMYVPSYSYYTERYKSNGKAYNKPFPSIASLSTFYKRFTGNEYNDDQSFYLPNLYDSTEERKWKVCGRYFNMNIMHLISGDAHKTVEFRFLRPTTDYSEIKWYLLILSAFLKYVINSKDSNYKKITVDKVIDFTFPKDIADKLKSEGRKLYHLHKVQLSYCDPGGVNQYRKEIYLTKIRKFSL